MPLKLLEWVRMASKGHLRGHRGLLRPAEVLGGHFSRAETVELSESRQVCEALLAERRCLCMRLPLYIALYILIYAYMEAFWHLFWMKNTLLPLQKSDKLGV